MSWGANRTGRSGRGRSDANNFPVHAANPGGLAPRQQQNQYRHANPAGPVHEYGGRNRAAHGDAYDVAGGYPTPSYGGSSSAYLGASAGGYGGYGTNASSYSLAAQAPSVIASRNQAIANYERATAASLLGPADKIYSPQEKLYQEPMRWGGGEQERPRSQPRHRDDGWRHQSPADYRVGYEDMRRGAYVDPSRADYYDRPGPDMYRQAEPRYERSGYGNMNPGGRPSHKGPPNKGGPGGWGRSPSERPYGGYGGGQSHPYSPGSSYGGRPPAGSAVRPISLPLPKPQQASSSGRPYEVRPNLGSGPFRSHEPFATRDRFVPQISPAPAGRYGGRFEPPYASRGGFRGQRPPRDMRRFGGRRRSPSPEVQRTTKEDKKASESEYECRVPRHPLFGPIRGVRLLKILFPNLHVSSDFIRGVFHFVDTEHFLQLPVFEAAPISLEFDGAKLPNTSDTIAIGTLLRTGPIPVKYYARVALIANGPDGDEDGAPVHKLRFLVAKKDKKTLLLPGGAWNQDVDGGDPSNPDDDALIRTAIRTCRELTQIDLSGCQMWLRCVEIHYHRPSEVLKGQTYDESLEITVIYVPNLWDMPIDREQFESTWRLFSQQTKAADLAGKSEEKKPVEKVDKEKEEAAASTASSSSSSAAAAATTQPEASSADDSEELKKATEKETTETTEEIPEYSSFLASCPRANHTLRLISLNGLLDYTSTDVQEKTFEVSLFAEAFIEMLQYHYGQRILAALERLPDLQQQEKEKQQKDKTEMATTATIIATTTTQTDKVQSETSGKRTAEDSVEPVAKRVKSDDAAAEEQTAEESAEGSAADVNGSADVAGESAADQLEQSQMDVEKPAEQIEAEREPVEEKLLGEDVLEAFRFFDELNVGYLKKRDLIDILYHADDHLAQHHIERLVSRLPPSDNGTKLFYKKLF